jgi:hypothetical protein
MAAVTSPAIAARAGSCTPIHIPLYQKSYEHRIKRHNGVRDWHCLQTPYAAGASSFCNVSYNGYTLGYSASGLGGCAPDSVCRAKRRVFNPSRPTQKEKTSRGETREYSP